MTLTELRYLLTLAKVKHFGKAAKACHISQPSLSVAINKLEKTLGVSIFERDRNQLRVTEIGQQIIQQAQHTLESANNIVSIAKASHSQLNTPLKVGAIHTVGPYLFPNLIPKLRHVVPEMPLLIQEDFTTNLRIKLREGTLDAIFVALPFNEAGVVMQELYDESFVVLLPKNHPLSKKKNISPRDIQTEEMLMLGEGHCFREQVISACPQCYNNTSSLHATHEGTSIETLRHMVASGMGITILPSSATQIQLYQNTLCIKPFAGKIPQRRIALAWRQSFTRPKAMGALIQALQASNMHGICLL